MSIVPEAFLFGVASALMFGILAGSTRFQRWASKVVHKHRKK
jgi:hypothetical protein